MLLEQNIKGEHCAISVYKAMIDESKDGDPVTQYGPANSQDEVEHEDLQSLKEDLEMMLSNKL